MKILHTSDWHLGKSLEGFSRIEEQEKFCLDLVDIVRKRDIDLVLLAGDVYDTYNPPARAENLFYDTLVKLAENGKRCVMVIAGNHDNPDRLEAINSMAARMGIVILGYPMSKASEAVYDGFEILEAKEGFTKIKIRDEIANIISIPYPSESRLNHAFENYLDKEDMQTSYSNKVGHLFRSLEENYRDGEINIAMSHIFVVGSSITDSERRIELGGGLLVEKDQLPRESQYTALGHIHKPQRMSKTYNAYYSGSPIQYSKSERDSAKSVYIVDIEAGSEAEVDRVYINNYKNIEVYRAKSVSHALDICQEKKDQDVFSYFEIETEESISQDTIKAMKSLMKNIIEIKPIIKSQIDQEEEKLIDLDMSRINDYFVDFYKKENEGLEPRASLVDLFSSLLGREEDHEAN